jgi:hypothetical protein
MSRPTMRFVPVKTAEQQGGADAGRGARSADPQSHAAVERHPRLCGRVRPDRRQGHGPSIRCSSALQADETCQPWRVSCSRSRQGICSSCRRKSSVDAKLMAWHKRRCLQPAPRQDPRRRPDRRGAAADEDPGARDLFRSGRQFAAWIGLTPKDHSTAGKVRLGVITRAGDEALRSVLVVGATAVKQQVRRGGTRLALDRRAPQAQSRRSWPPWRWPTRRPHRLEADGHRRKLQRTTAKPHLGGRNRDQPDTGSNSTATVLSRCQNLQGKRADGVIDRSKMRDTPKNPWPFRGRLGVWNSRRGNHLGQRSCASAQTGRTYGRKRSDQSTAQATLQGGGRPHMPD